MNARLPHISVFVFIVTWARLFFFFFMFAENVGRKGKRMGRAWGIFPWRCARRCRRKEWPRTMKWQMNWWQNSAHQTTTCHRMTQWALPLCDTVSVMQTDYSWWRYFNSKIYFLMFWIASFFFLSHFSMCMTRRTFGDAFMMHLTCLWPWTLFLKRKKKSSGLVYPPTQRKSAKT